MPIRNDPTRQRFPALSGRLIVDTYRGKVRIRRWPRKRTRPLPDVTTRQNDWFREACRLAKLCEPSQQTIAKFATAHSGLYPRDLLIRAMSVGYCNIVYPDGTTITRHIRRIEDVVFQGAIIEKTATQPLVAGTLTPVTWNLPTLDTANVWDIANPTRLTVPPTVTVANFSGGIGLASGASRTLRLIFRKNGTVFLSGSGNGATTTPQHTTTTGPVVVAPGDYIELLALCSGTGSINATPISHVQMTIMQGG